MPSHIFYEVRDNSGAIWGGESARECYDFFSNSVPFTSIWVSEWEGEGEDMWQTKEAINITPFFREVRMSAMKEVKKWVLRSV